MDQDEIQGETDSNNNSSNDKDDYVNQQDAHVSSTTTYADKVTIWNIKPVNEDCKLLLEWATEFVTKPDESSSPRDGDEKRASSKGFSSATTFCSVHDY